MCVRLLLSRKMGAYANDLKGIHRKNKKNQRVQGCGAGRLIRLLKDEMLKLSVCGVDRHVPKTPTGRRTILLVQPNWNFLFVL